LIVIPEENKNSGVCSLARDSQADMWDRNARERQSVDNHENTSGRHLSQMTRTALDREMRVLFLDVTSTMIQADLKPNSTVSNRYWKH